MIIQRLFSKVSKHKRIRVRNVEDPRNHAEIETGHSHNSGPGWSENSESYSYSEERHYSLYEGKTLTGIVMSLVTILGGWISNKVCFKKFKKYGEVMKTNPQLEKNLIKYMKDHSDNDIVFVRFPKDTKQLECSCIALPTKTTEKQLEYLKEEAEMVNAHVDSPETALDWTYYAAINRVNVLMYLESDHPVAIAHEFGHYLEEKREKGKFMDKKLDTKLAGLAAFCSMILGAFGPIGVATSVLTGMASSSPTLYNEYRASWYGYQILKEIGATEEELRDAEKYLKLAWSTYASGSVVSGGMLSAVGSCLRAHTI